MLSRSIIKRYCHTHGRSKCYENIHKIDSLRQEVSELKELLKQLDYPLTMIYRCSGFSLLGTICLVLTNR
jgi:hypothetical protein